MNTKAKISVKTMCLAAMFTALVAVGAQITIPAPIVPFTLQTFMVMMAGLMLGSRAGTISLLVYTLLGLVGVPIFAGGNGGIGMIYRPGFGFILGFIVCAFLTGFLSQRLKFHGGTVVACVAGLLAIYIIGVPYMYIILKYVMGGDTTVWGALKSGFLLFIPAEVVKTAAAVTLSAAVKRRF